MTIARQYSKEVRSNLGYFPVWLPGTEIHPGDAGELEGGIFIRQTNVSELIGRDVTPARTHNGGEHLFQSKGAVVVTGSVTGTVRVELKREGAVVFHAEDMTEWSLADLHDV